MKHSVFHPLVFVLVATTLHHAADANDVTFSQHIAPLVHSKCSLCHREGQSGPFELLTFEDVRDRAATIQAVVHDNYMPPWKPVNTNVRFANDRRLTPGERKLLDDWIDNGMPAGDLDAITPPTLPGGWSLGEPDLVLRMGEAFQVPASGPDIYRSFVLPTGLTEDRWVKAVEVRPSARGVVHHALLFIDQAQAARQDDGRDGQPGFTGMKFMRAGGLNRVSQLSNILLSGYVPGAMPNRLPGDLAIHLPGSSDIVMQTHFHPSGKAESEQTEIGLYFADRPPSRQLTAIQLPPMFGRFSGLDVPAGDADYEISQSFTVPINVEAIAVTGHAHYICREMEMIASLPDGTTTTLLAINDWDLDWQDQYQFAEPILLPQGTRLDVRIQYDNSADNPENPFSPPQRIEWGRESTDEMGSVTLRVVASEEAQLPQLQLATRDLFKESIRQNPGGLLNSRFGNMIGKPAFRKTMLAFLDRNKDGSLQAAEFPERARKQFMTFADTDNNDVVDARELSTALKQLERLRHELSN